jgi:hypothetical protein
MRRRPSLSTHRTQKRGTTTGCSSRSTSLRSADIRIAAFRLLTSSFAESLNSVRKNYSFSVLSQCVFFQCSPCLGQSRATCLESSKPMVGCYNDWSSVCFMYPHSGAEPNACSQAPGSVEGGTTFYARRGASRDIMCHASQQGCR